MPNIWQISGSLHKSIHEGAGGGRYNQRWKEELEKLDPEDVTAENVLGIRDNLAEEFGFAECRP